MVPANPADNTPAPDYRLPRSKRLTHAHQFEEAFASGTKFVGKLMVLWLRSAPDADGRLGIVTSRKVGGAVQRNRARRMIREAFRLNQHAIAKSADLVFVARFRLPEASLEDVEKELLKLAAKAGLRLKNGDQP